MKRSVQHHHHQTVKGMGYFIGYMVALVFALLFYFISKTFVVAIASFVSIGTTLGIVFEQKLEKENKESNPNNSKVFIALLVLGIVVFISLFFYINR